MTKQEQIEEMISAMAASNNPFVDVPVEIMPKVAEALYNAGYRKVSADTLILTENQLKKIIEEEYKKALKNKVVLSMEEYETLANQYKNLEIKYSNLSDNYRLCKDANETLKQNIIITRNETVEKILRDLYSEATSNVSETVELTTFQIEQLAKQYGVEIKE